MNELLDIYDLEDNFLETKDRKDFYDEIKEEFLASGKISKQIKTIRLILMNSEGRIFLQKRSKLKNENPGLYDKTVGGHVSSGDTYNMTVIKECAEELGFPSAILKREEFEKAIKNIRLDIVGLFREVDYISNFQSNRVDKEGSVFVQPHMTKIYIGYYNGAIKFVDGESSGIEVFSLEELREEIKNNPDKFTEDIKFMVEKYKELLKPVK